ncbi:outer membrane protein assembly factor BamB family protein [Gimesia panareensis]|uniref:outer membrane protein assembly factor BamB family protein n=1 Tax=Gimesia panareensis TaxID=2527978 RepID=UPI00118AC3E4|nr:PQQ-binding-like beta-propeller repeat protein [Gimesia panareensis]QDU53762.1 outer membrane biogenesis protein BamB [Gimesia panareensis]
MRPPHFILLLLFILPTTLTAQDRWPGFLGAGASPIKADTIPTQWSPEQNIAWKAGIPGYGQSSPVIWGDQVYVTSVEGPNKEQLHVVCYSLKSGKQLWDHVQPSTNPEKNSVYISRAAPTPVLDENGIYAYFESGDIVALSHAGKLKWTASLAKRYGAPQNKFGLSASPVQWKDRVVVLIDDEGPSYITAVSKADGSELWKTDRKSRASWSSPMIVPVGEAQQVVCSSAGTIDGYDPQTGKQLWSYAQVGGNNKTSPLPAGNGEFLIGASPGREGDNNELAKKSNGLFVVKQQDNAWQPGFVWTNASPTPSWGTPIVYRGHAYWVNRVGVVYCLNAGNGESIFTSRIKESCWATPVGIGDHIYFFGKNGVTTVLKAGNTFEIVAENELWTEDAPPVNNVPTAEETTAERRRASAMFSRPTLYGAGVVNGYLVLRTGSQLYCLQQLAAGR